jgi:hypothetical protein
MESSPSFLEFCGIIDVELTDAQRVLCSVAFDNLQPADLSPQDRGLASQLFGPVDHIPESARAVLAVVCGARSGKSYVLGGLYSLWRAFTADLSTLAPGEQATALIVAPDIRLSRQTVRYALGAAKSEPSIARLIESDSADGFTLRRRDGALVSVECLPATRGGSAVRGRSLVSAVLDECAFFKDESASVNDADIFRAVAPRVIPGGLVIIASTPWAETGLLFTEFSENFGDPKSSLAATAPTSIMRPDARTATMIARERSRDPDNCAREFDAKFLTGGSGLFFPPAILAGLIDHDLEVAYTLTGRARGIVAGDFGLVRDCSAFVALHVDGSTISVAEVLELRPTKGKPLKLSEVVSAACEFAERHGTKELFVDHHSLEPAREHLPKGFRLSPCDPSQDSKIRRYEATRALLGEGRITCPGSLSRIAGQLGEVIARPTAGGGLTISSPRRGGTHGDLCSAFVLGASLASNAGHDPKLFRLANQRLGAAPRGFEPPLFPTDLGLGSRWTDHNGRGFG